VPLIGAGSTPLQPFGRATQPSLILGIEFECPRQSIRGIVLWVRGTLFELLNSVSAEASAPGEDFQRQSRGSTVPAQELPEPDRLPCHPERVSIPGAPAYHAWRSAGPIAHLRRAGLRRRGSFGRASLAFRLRYRTGPHPQFPPRGGGYAGMALAGIHVW
jgi:hypothetical protein